MSAPESFASEIFIDSINFDELELTAGTIITSQFSGLEFSTPSEFGLMLFDTNNVTGEDFDLSATDLDNVLIISEDGDISEPDDSAAGGTISLEFDELVAVNSIGILDIDEPGSSISFYDADNLLVETVAIEALGDRSFQELKFDLNGIASLEIDLAGSGAVTGIDFDPAPADISNIYVFGDSLVDTGNLFNLTSATQELRLPGLAVPTIPPSPPYFAGRFSSGQIWIDNLAEALNIELTPATALAAIAPGSDILSPVTLLDNNPVVSPFLNGATTSQSVNFGFGLATTGANGTGELGSFVPGLGQQVDFFIADRLQADLPADDEALYILWAGSNDYFLPDAEPAQIVGNIQTELESLYGIGARDFLVVNLADLGQIPEANNPNLTVSPEELTTLSQTHNSLLASTVDELEDTLVGSEITILDANSLLDDVFADPVAFGLTNVTEPFLDPLTFTPTVGADPDDFFFFDTLHPTAVGHQILSDFALETLGIEADL